MFPASIFSEQIRVLLSILCYYKESLPQGAPSSPAITNIIMKPFDENVGAWCGERGVSYTRYCDDMAFSGEFDEKAVFDFVSRELKKYGFFLNRKKTRYAEAAQRQAVTGVVVNEKINAPASYRKKLRQELYYCGKLGIRAHMDSLGITESEQAYLRRLLGRVNYVLSLTPDSAEMLSYREWLLEQLKKR